MVVCDKCSDTLSLHAQMPHCLFHLLIDIKAIRISGSGHINQTKQSSTGEIIEILLPAAQS